MAHASPATLDNVSFGSSTKRRHFDMLPCWDPMQEGLARFMSKRLRQSSQSEWSHRQTKQMPGWGQRHGMAWGYYFYFAMHPT